MGDFNRMDRISEVIQKELAYIIHQELRERVGIVTLAQVKVSKDLGYARIYVSVLSEKADDSIEILNKSAKFLRGLLAKRVKLRVMPMLSFYNDEITLRANKISKLIDEARARDEK